MTRDQAAPGSPAAADIGRRLRQRRKVRGESLSQVAARASVSIGLLSQIERGLTMPTVKSLGAICAALEMPVSWLFAPGGDAGAGDGDIVVRRRNRRVLDLGGHGILKELLTPDDCPEIQMMRFVIAPGGGSGDQPYNNPTGGKCGIVLRGVLGLEIEGRRLRIEAGDSFAFPATRLIRFRAEDGLECEVLWVVAPAVY